MTAQAPQESMLGLARKIVRGLLDLARLEIERGRQELGQGLAGAGRGAMLIGLGLLFAVLLLIGLVVLLIALLALLIPLWASALVFVLAFLVLALLLGFLGVRRLMAARDDLTIPETRAAIQEDMAWARRLLRRG